MLLLPLLQRLQTLERPEELLVEGGLGLGVQHHPAVDEVQGDRTDGLEGEAVEAFLVQL